MTPEEIAAMQANMAEATIELKKINEKTRVEDEARKAAIAEIAAEQKKTFGTLSELQTKTSKISEDMAQSTILAQATQAHIDQLTKELKSLDLAQGRSDKDEVKHLLEYAELNHNARNPERKNDNLFKPDKIDIKLMELAVAGLKKYMRMPHGSDRMAHLSDAEWKAMTTFAFSGNSFILAPLMARRVLSCLEDITDVSGMFSSMNISKGSVKFLTDNDRIDRAAWACEAQCFANNPKPFLEDHLGELEIRAETLRYSLCATRDLLEDAEVDLETWMLNKVRDAFRRTLSEAFMIGDGNGKPIGILNPTSGIPICDVSTLTPTTTFTWQDLFMLKWQVAVQYHAGAAYMMNQNTLALALTLADANNRPLMVADPTQPGVLQIAGSPVRINTWMPNVATGSTPVAFGNWPATYMAVYRKSLQFQRDDYSAGFCILYKFESRVGGAIVCPNASRLMRIN